MNPMPNILRFGWPYLRRYRGRLACGIALGILFGLTNVGFVWATRTVTERLTPPAAVPPAMTGKLPDVGATTPATGALRQAGNVVQKHLDPWLPLHGRKPDWRQILGGLLLLPLMIGARGFAGYLGGHFLPPRGRGGRGARGRGVVCACRVAVWCVAGGGRGAGRRRARGGGSPPPPPPPPPPRGEAIAA